MKGFDETLRKRIQRHRFWIEKAADANFLETVTLVSEIDFVEGFQGEAGIASQVTCLLHRWFQLQPTLELLQVLIAQADLKYLRFFAVLYVRMAFEDPVVVHGALDVAFGDYRRLRVKDTDGTVRVVSMDEVTDVLANEAVLVGIPLPALLSRANTAMMAPEMLRWPRSHE